MLRNSRDTQSRRKEECSHEVVFMDVCGICATRLDTVQSSSVAMIHSVPELRVSKQFAKELGDADQKRLIRERKLVLLVDLDQTILHTTHQEVKNDPGVHSFKLHPEHLTYNTKLRPHLAEFLEEMSKIYELHIFTFGCRSYAHKIASIIDPDQKYFGNRILSRDESVDQSSKQGNLNNLFPCGDAMVCIIDDRADVWRNAGNLIQVKPYHYFKTSISDGAAPMNQQPGEDEDDDEDLAGHVHELEALLGMDDETAPQATPTTTTSTTTSTIAATTTDPQPDVPDQPKDSSETEGEKLKEFESNIQDNEACEEVKKKRFKRSEEEDDKDVEAEEQRTEVTENRDEEELVPEQEMPTDYSKHVSRETSSDDKPSQTTPDQEVEEDPDNHLLHLTNILSRIHEKWYMELDHERQFLEAGESYKLPDIKDIIRKYLRKRF